MQEVNIRIRVFRSHKTVQTSSCVFVHDKIIIRCSEVP